MHEPFRIDDSGMPLRLGSALRVPSYAYSNWGIPEGKYRKESDELYSVEWEGGSPRQMQYVIDAITRTGLGNYSQILRDANARIVSAAVEMMLSGSRESRGRIYILEPGFGVSTVNAVDEMLERGTDLDRVYITGVEPSQKRCDASAAELEKRGLKKGKNFQTVADIDNRILEYVGPESQDIICSVAQIHHHAYLDTPLAVIHAALKPGGIFTSSDWHNSMWEHPNRVYRFLQELEWETKERDLEEFARAYPKALEEAFEPNPEDGMSNEHIRRFWKGWIEVRREAIEREEFDPDDEILMLEGHRPVERYEEEMGKAGLVTEYAGFVRELYEEAGLERNPHQHLEDSRILMTVTGARIGV